MLLIHLINNRSRASYWLIPEIYWTCSLNIPQSVVIDDLHNLCFFQSIYCLRPLIMIYEDHLLLTYIHDTTSGYESLQLALLIQNRELSECTLRDHFTNIINIIIYVELTQLILRCHKMLHRNTLIDQSRYIECVIRCLDDHNSL